MGFEEVFLSSAIGPIQHAARKVKLSPELANVVRLVQHLGWAWSNEYAQGIGPTTFSARSAQVPGRKQQGGNFAILPSAPGESLQDNTGGWVHYLPTWEHRHDSKSLILLRVGSGFKIEKDTARSAVLHSVTFNVQVCIYEPLLNPGYLRPWVYRSHGITISGYLLAIGICHSWRQEEGGWK